MIVALTWVLGLPLLAAPAVFGAVGWLARTERESAVATPDSVAPGLRVAYVPPDSPDALIANPGVMLALGFLLLPPLALCLTWIVARRRRPAQSA